MKPEKTENGSGGAHSCATAAASRLMHISGCMILIIYHLLSFIMTFHDLLVIYMILYDL